MTPERRNPGGQAGASDHVFAGGIEAKGSVFPSGKQHIATIEKNPREEVGVLVGDFGPVHFIQFRVYVQNGELLPVEGGFSLPVERIDDLIAASVAARAEAVRRGWLP